MKKLAILATVFVTGCATMFSGGPSMVSGEIDADTDAVTTTFQSLDSGRKIVKTGRKFTVELDRGSEWRAKVEAEGYEPETVTVRRSFNFATLLNLLLSPLGLLIGGIVDFSSGAAWVHDKYIVVSPGRKAAPKAATPSSL